MHKNRDFALSQHKISQGLSLSLSHTPALTPDGSEGSHSPSLILSVTFSVLSLDHLSFHVDSF